MEKLTKFQKVLLLLSVIQFFQGNVSDAANVNSAKLARAENASTKTTDSSILEESRENPLAELKRTQFPSKIWRQITDIPVNPSINIGISPESEKKIEAQMKATLANLQIPGGELAISHNGNLVYAGGFGYADLATREPVKANSLFRIASLSKVITSTAIYKLQDEGKLNVSDKAFHIIPDMLPPPGKKCDPKVLEVKVSDLANMTAGWEQKGRKDALFMPTIAKISREAETLSPPPLEAICHYELAKPFDNPPGTKYSYSNLSYALLGKIITEKSELDYPDYCKQNLFAPLGITAIQAGKRQSNQRYAGEVTYYPENLNALRRSIFSTDVGKKESPPYGEIDVERYTAAFGWVSDAESILKFANGINTLLSKPTVDQMLARPVGVSNWKNSSNYVSAAFEASSDYNKGKATLCRDGTICGSRAFLVSFPNGVSCCALFNRRLLYVKNDPFKKEINALFKIAKAAN